MDTSLIDTRFFIHQSIQLFADAIIERFGRPGEKALLFPTRATAKRCVQFLHRHAPFQKRDKIRIIELTLENSPSILAEIGSASPGVCATLFPSEESTLAKSFWQHSGDGISSRRAEFSHYLFKSGLLVEKSKVGDESLLRKTPKRYRSNGSANSTEQSSGLGQSAKSTTIAENQDPSRHIEERFGRNLDFSMAESAKLAIRRRIAASVSAEVDLTQNTNSLNSIEETQRATEFSESNVFLYPAGMSAIFNTHQALLAAKGELKSLSYG